MWAPPPWAVASLVSKASQVIRAFFMLPRAPAASSKPTNGGVTWQAIFERTRRPSPSAILPSTPKHPDTVWVGYRRSQRAQQRLYRRRHVLQRRWRQNLGASRARPDDDHLSRSARSSRFAARLRGCRRPSLSVPIRNAAYSSRRTPATYVAEGALHRPPKRSFGPRH